MGGGAGYNEIWTRTNFIRVGIFNFSLELPIPRLVLRKRTRKADLPRMGKLNSQIEDISLETTTTQIQINIIDFSFRLVLVPRWASPSNLISIFTILWSLVHIVGVDGHFMDCTTLLGLHLKCVYLDNIYQGP
jgi:hypothetical protein